MKQITIKVTNEWCLPYILHGVKRADLPNIAYTADSSITLTTPYMHVAGAIAAQLVAYNLDFTYRYMRG